MKKLSVLICSLRPEDKSDHGDVGSTAPPPLLSCSSNRPQLVATAPAGAQVALEGARFSQSVSRLQMLLSIALCVPQTSP